MMNSVYPSSQPEQLTLINESYSHYKLTPSRKILTQVQSSNLIKVNFPQSQSAHPSFQYFLNDYCGNLQMCPKIHLKKGMILPKGIYMLRKGRIVYAPYKKESLYEKKQYLQTILKNYTQILQHNNLLENDLKNVNGGGTLVLIEDKSSVIFSYGDSYLGFEDSSLIVLNQSGSRDDYFQAKLQQIQDLVTFCHYKGKRNHNEEVLFVDCLLSHSFGIKRYSFNHVFCLKYPLMGIIKSGNIVHQDENIHGQINRYSLILPNIHYRVSSDSAQVLVISNNPTLFIACPELRQFIQGSIDKISKNLNPPKSVYARMYNQKKRSQVIAKQKFQTKVCQKIYQKQLNETNKNFQEFMIVPMKACELNLEFSHKQLKKKKFYQGICRAPNILFDYDNSRRNRNVPSLQKVFHDANFSFSNFKNKKKFEEEQKYKKRKDFLKYFKPHLKKIYESKENNENYSMMTYGVQKNHGIKPERKTAAQMKHSNFSFEENQNIHKSSLKVSKSVHSASHQNFRPLKMQTHTFHYELD